MSILINTPFNRTQCINFNGELTTASLKTLIYDFEGIPLEDLVIVCNGHTLQNDDKVTKNQMYQVFLRLQGGKGGFGSMLRAIGAQIEKTTNREACRDLSGRRLRDINDEKRLKTWIAKQAERERETERHRKERLERRLAMPRHEFKDPTYEAQRLAIPERVDEAVYQGLCKNGDAGPSHKRKYDSNKTSENEKKIKSKKSCLWIGVEVDSDLSEPDEKEDSRESSSADSSSRSCTAAAFCEDSNTEESITNNGFALTTSSTMSSESSNNLKEICESAESTCSSEASSSQLVPHSTAAKNNRSPSMCADKDTGIEQPDQNEIAQLVTAHTITGNGIDHMDQNDTSQKMQHSIIMKSNDLSDLKGTSTGLEQVTQSKAVKLVTNLPESGDNLPVTGTLNLDNYHVVEELEALGLEELKFALMTRGLKCGGTLRQRAERLLAVKGLQPHEIDGTLFAKNIKKK